MMVALSLFALTAVSIRQDATALRSGCDSSSDVVTTLGKGAAVEIKSSMSDGGPTCYKIAAFVDGATVTGYVRANQLDDTSSFEQARQNAGVLSSSVKQRTEQAEKVIAASSGSGSNQLATAVELIKSNRPGEALAQLEPIARVLRDPNVLALTGVAAWKSDDPKKALEYWSASLQLAANPGLEQLMKSVEREVKNDKSGERAYGLRVLLRFERESVSADLARTMAAVLDQEFDRISAELGCAWHERLVAVVQSREAYLRTTAAAEWSGGQFDGRIRVSFLDESGVGPVTRRAFAHELTHACLSNLGNWPAWVQEGLAQRLSGERTSASSRARITQLASERALPRLDEMSQNWSRLNGASAAVAYDLALLAVDTIFERYSNYGIRNILANRTLLQQLTQELDSSLKLGR